MSETLFTCPSAATAMTQARAPSRIWVLSDLHLEQSIWQPPIGVEADIVLLAGDVLTPLVRAIDWLAKERDRGAFQGMEIVVVAGNHEYYGRDIDREREAGRMAAARAGIHFLDQDAVTIRGIRYLGATLWTDYAANGDVSHAMHTAEHALNDHRMIRCRGGRFRPQDACQRHQADRAFLEQTLANSPHPSVVVTHHAPSPGSLHRRYVGDALNPAYYSDLDALIARSGAALWLHGHMHQSSDYTVGTTRVLCNPKGYGPIFRPGFLERTIENATFESQLVVTIGGDQGGSSGRRAEPSPEPPGGGGPDRHGRVAGCGFGDMQPRRDALRAGRSSIDVVDGIESAPARPESGGMASDDSKSGRVERSRSASDVIESKAPIGCSSAPPFASTPAKPEATCDVR